MNVSPVGLNYTTTKNASIPSPKGHVQNASFGGRKSAVADDRDIKWSGIFALCAVMFTVAAVATLGIKRSIEHLKKSAEDFAEKVSDFAGSQGAKRASQAGRKAKPIKNPEIVLDTDKLRALPKDVLRQAKDAINNAVTSDEYKKVLRDFNIYKPA